jgi:hypothetical protein
MFKAAAPRSRNVRPGKPCGREKFPRRNQARFSLHRRAGRTATSPAKGPQPRYAEIPQNRSEEFLFEITGIFAASHYSWNKARPNRFSIRPKQVVSW